MKRHLNTSYRLVWNHITGTLVVASELARSRGKRAGVAVALSLAAVTSVPALAADTVVQAGETVSGGTLENHDNQIVFGTANGMTISTGLEYGPDNEANTGGQWIQNGGIANNTTVTGGGLQRVNAGGSVSDTVISAGGGQSLQGQAVNTTLNGGEQWVHEGGIATGTVINEKGLQAVKSGAVATDTVVNTGAEGGPDAENGDTGQFVRGNAVRTTINENGRQIVAAEGTANTTVVYAGGDQTVHGYALDTTLNGGNQYVHNGGTASDTVVNSDGWQIVKEGGLADFTIVNQKGKLQVNAGGTATNVTLKQGGALVTSTAATVTGSNRLGNFAVENGKADGVVLESGGRLDVLEGHSAQKTRVDDGGT
ncbi:AIDA repeat-containing protein, partial [Escherichia coli]|uniref:AIDA repeat-containing protein n=1 Tax=Escherichia coli TaxID=562 RepID=UPI001BCA3F39